MLIVAGSCWPLEGRTEPTHMKLQHASSTAFCMSFLSCPLPNERNSCSLKAIFDPELCRASFKVAEAIDAVAAHLMA